ASDLWSALSKAAGKDVAGPMASFLDQPGVPLVKSELLSGASVRLSQRRFLNDGVPPPGSAIWQIPISLKYSDGRMARTRTILLKEPSRIVTLEGARRVAFLHPNAGETGYYRWEVSPQM